MTINAGNDEIYEITMDGTQVREVTVDGVIAWVEANFDVRNLTAPNEVTEGDNFTITADVKNTGDGRDTQTISFNRGGSTNKTLKGGQTTTVSFGETINNNGDFTLKISSDDDSASQTVTVLTPAFFDIRNLSAPNTVTEGNSFNVSADVVNTGQTSDTQNIDFNRGGSTNKSLSGNSSTNVSFNETINSTGDFNLSVSSADDTESRNITVESAIPDSVLPQDLVAWYRFEDGDARDYTATLDANFADTTAYDGTINGATFQSSSGVTDFENGASSAYFEHDGDDYIELGIKGSDITSPFSIMFWWKGTDTGFSHSCYTSDGSLGPSFYFYNQDDVLEFKDEHGTNEEVGTGAIPQNQWAHLAVVVGATDVKHYIDGTRVFTDSGAGHTGKVYSDIPIQQGILRPGDRPWVGDYDGTRIYQTELTDSQINQIYQDTKP